MAKQTNFPDGLTRNQSLVLNVLVEKSGPLSAYGILDLLRAEGFRAPLQVYRALETLVLLGKVHKLESINSFIACSHPNCSTKQISAFGICDECMKVFEIADVGLNDAISDLASSHSFIASKAMIELRGLCKTCQGSSDK